LRLLLDTHAAIWSLTGDERLGRAAKRRLADSTDDVLLSAAVVWEVAIKRSLRKLKTPPDFGPTLLGAGARALPITVEHAAAVEQLPWHHRDPFDRMLVAQAMVENAAIVSADERLSAYGVEMVW
jgi:PIN domain nuclease of toxin-antitoxin system